MLKFDFNFLWTIFNLVLFFVLMRLFLFKPIKKTMDKRKELIDNQFKAAEEANALAEEKMADYEKKIANAYAEGDQIIAQARDDAKVEYSKIIDRAEKDASDMKDAARKQIKIEQDAARRVSQEEIASLAMQAAEKVVGKSVSAQSDSDIFDEFLNEGSVD